MPIRDGPTVWEIGYPDRTAATYYVPDVNPIYVNKLFINTPEKYDSHLYHLLFKANQQILWDEKEYE